MVATQVSINDRPSAVRYPRGEGRGVEMPEVGIPLEIGKGRVIRQGNKIALLSFGTRMPSRLIWATVRGTKIVAGTPKCFAAYAIPNP